MPVQCRLLAIFLILTACSDSPTVATDLGLCQAEVDVEGAVGSDFRAAAFFVNEGGSSVPMINIVSVSPGEPQVVSFTPAGSEGDHIPPFDEGSYPVSPDFRPGYVSAVYGTKEDHIFEGTSGTLTLDRVTSAEIRGSFSVSVLDAGGRTGRISGAFRAAAGLCVPGGS